MTSSSRRALGLAVLAGAAPLAAGAAGWLPPADPEPGYVIAEGCLLTALAAGLALACAPRPGAPSRLSPMGMGAATGALVFVALAGLRIVNPAETGWLMRGDWAWHQGGWHVFRSEPWRWPIGRVDHLFFPDGTSIGLTDSIPAVAIPLKVVAPFLPSPFQYFGAWFALSFVLLGAWAARLAGTATGDPRLMAAAALLAVSLPVFVARVGHIALTAHWILVAAITWHVEPAGEPREVLWGRWLWLGALTSAVHPYLAAMVASLALAWVAREVVARRLTPARGSAVAGAFLAVTAWTAWLCGDFVAGGGALAASGVGDYSLDLLAPVNGAGWSALLPAWPFATAGQAYEGLAYPGAGVLALILCALVLVVVRRPSPGDWRHVAPLAIACGLLVLAAIGPVATAGGRPMWRLEALAASPLVAAFRASGRFVWPAEYALALGAVLAICGRLRPRVAGVVLAAALVLQVVDLHAVWQRNYRGTRTAAAFFAWQSPLQAAPWRHVGAVFSRLALVPGPECGPAPAALEPLVGLAGDQGLAFTSGTAARVDVVRTRRRCAALFEAVAAAALDPRMLYVVHPDRLGSLPTSPGVTCVVLDGLNACGEARQMRRWLD